MVVYGTKNGTYFSSSVLIKAVAAFALVCMFAQPPKKTMKKILYFS